MRVLPGQAQTSHKQYYRACQTLSLQADAELKTLAQINIAGHPSAGRRCSLPQAGRGIPLNTGKRPLSAPKRADCPVIRAQEKCQPY